MPSGPAAAALVAWGVAVPVDPGTHVVRAEAPGKRPFETSIEVSSASAARVAVDVPPLEDEGADHPAGAVATATAPAETDTTGTTSTRTTVGWVIGGVGVASLGVASYFGLHAFSRWSDRNAACVGGCTADAQSAGHDAAQAATISDIGFGVGLAALAVGTYLVLSGRSEHDRHSSSTDDHSLRVAPSVGSRGGGVVVGGAW